MSRLLLSVQHVIHSEVVAGMSLFVAAGIALLWANSSYQQAYWDLVSAPLGFHLASFTVSFDLRHWVNDGLMVLFFFVVGLEIKREFIYGELADWRKAMFPGGAALGGMIVPALTYWAFNYDRETAAGWGIPIPTDIAFALGVLALIGKRIPLQLRMALLALAIVDDIGAILIIALFYANKISWLAVTSALAILVLIYGMRLVGVRNVVLYVVMGALFWFAVLSSGIHATIAGVILGAITPGSAWFSHPSFAARLDALLRRFKHAQRQMHAESANVVLGQIETLTKETEAVLDRLQRIISPWVSYGVLPLFALVNSGVTISEQHLHESLTSPIGQGVMLGLFLGKPIGVLAGIWIMLRLKLAQFPTRVTWTQVSGMAVLAGIGFTVSLFITGLAFDNAQHAEQAKIGILAASTLAASTGALLLLFTNRGQIVQESETGERVKH